MADALNVNYLDNSLPHGFNSMSFVNPVIARVLVDSIKVK
jgi:hypothetical protein